MEQDNLQRSFLIVKHVADNFLSKEVRLSQGRSYMPAGHNGPYYDLETPIRNTSHWLITYSRLYQETGSAIYLDIASRLSNYLVDPGEWLKNDVYIHRQKHGKDWCNGVIGQAWVIEALNVAASSLGRPDLRESALRAARVFAYDYKVGAWIKTDPRNNKEAIDYTLNHQTWFAAAVSELDDPELTSYVAHYIDGLCEGAMRIRKDGVIAHLLYKKSWKSLLLRLRYSLSEARAPKEVRKKEVGYHLFNLHPFARIFKKLPEHNLFRQDFFKRSLQVITQENFLTELEGSLYAYPYNAPAFEYPLVCEVFGLVMPDEVFRTQISSHFNEEFGGFYNCPDYTTLNARIYELLVLVRSP